MIIKEALKYGHPIYVAGGPTHIIHQILASFRLHKEYKIFILMCYLLLSRFEGGGELYFLL